jgi:thioesterase III
VKTLEMVERRGIGPAIVHIDLHFHREIRIHEEVVVRTWFDALEGLKGIIGQEMIKRDGAVASRARFTFVMFDLKSRKVIRVPDDLRRLYEQDAAYRQERQAHAASGSA